VGRTSLSAALAVDVDVVTDVIGALGDVAKTQIKKTLLLTDSVDFLSTIMS